MNLVTDKEHKPTLAQIDEYIGNPLFEALCGHMQREYQALVSIDYSGDQILLGWNVRFCKAGRTLCRIYPHQGCFHVLVVVGPREKARVESALPCMSEGMRAVYHATKEGMGQRWLVYELTCDDALYRDTLEIIRARRESRSSDTSS